MDGDDTVVVERFDAKMDDSVDVEVVFGSSTMGQYMRDHLEEMSEFLGSPANVCDSIWEYENGICKETKKIENK